MKLVFATMIRAADRWCRVSVSDLERHQLTAEGGARIRPATGNTDNREPPAQKRSRMINRPPIYRTLRTDPVGACREM